MSDYTERNVVDFKIHNLTEEQFQELKEQGKIDPNAVYCTPDTTKERLDATVNYNNITNCITHIPQDIKLELGGTKQLYAWTTENDTLYTDTTQAGAYDIKVYNASGQNVTPAMGTIYISSDGAYIWCDVDTISKHYRDTSNDKTIDYGNSLVLKAGSKVYVPNGFEADGTTPKFDVVTIENDVTLDGYSNPNTKFILGYNVVTGEIASTYNGVSGTTPPASTCFFYNTSTNKLNYISGGTTKDQYSFPLALFTMSNSVITSIDQVFNGFGYIGSTIFALPGIKGLIPNGRNEDGTLKNSVLTTSRVFTTTSNAATSNNVLLISNWSVDRLSKSNYFYDVEKNIIINKANNIQLPYVMYGSNITTNGVISNFKTNHTFRAVDYSDTEFIAHQAMPSNRYEDVELRATGTSYTAPADGWFILGKKSSAVGEFINIDNGGNTRPSVYVWSVLGNKEHKVYVPVKKGDSIYISYSMGGDTTFFRFVYANGSK